MSVVARTIKSTPVRSATETWKAIVYLLARDDSSDAHRELLSVSGTASALIGSEAMADAAVVCAGSGPRVRVYCIYNEDAITGEDANESPLQHCPTEDDWEVSLPCPTEDLDWVNRSLSEKSNRILVRDMADRLGPKDEKHNSTRSTNSAEINKEAFLRP